MSTRPTTRARPASMTPWLLVAMLVILLDQATKLTFDSLLSYGERLHVLPVFDLTLLYNRGAAFSFLAAEGGWQRWFFTALALVAAAFIIWLLRRYPQQRLFCAALSLILGGALGNVIDRIAYGHVIDFLLFYWGQWHFPAFNLADAAITVGAILLIYDELHRSRVARKADRTI